MMGLACWCPFCMIAGLSGGPGGVGFSTSEGNAMSRVCAVRFSRHGRLYYLEAGAHRPVVGEYVLVPTDDGPEVAQCVWPAQEVRAQVGGLPELVGPAGPADLARDERNRRRRAQARVVARRLIRQHRLPMKVLAVDYADRAHRFTVYFSAPGRVDFRDLGRDLAQALAARVDLRLLSARDQARVQGGIGPCGRDLCCATLLRDFEPVAVRMAKDQELPLNVLRIAGSCGRLLCCLRYEHPLYREFRRQAPEIGSQVQCPDGVGRVLGHNVPADAVLVRLESGSRCLCDRASAAPAAPALPAAQPSG